MFFSEHHAAAFALINDLAGLEVAVVSHVRPDGDCVGAAVALTRILRAQGISAVALNRHPMPDRLGNFAADTPLRFGVEEAGAAVATVYVDCAAPDRAGETLAPKLPEAVGNLDHHVTNPCFARHNVVAPDAAATCELLAGLAHDLGWPVDAVTATALYAGIFTDTGGFRHSALSARTFELVAWLVGLGADASAIANQLTTGKPWGALDLLERFLQSRERHLDGRLAFAQTSQRDFAETGTSREDAEDFPGMLAVAAGVAVAAAFEELIDGRWKCSLRTTEASARVDRLAERNGGGGHPRAAGFTLREPFDTFRETFISQVEAHLNKEMSGADPSRARG